MIRGFARSAALTVTLAASLTATAFAQSAPPPEPATPFAIGGIEIATNTPATTRPTQGTAVGLRLYALDCGRIQVADMGMFSDTGEYDGRPGNLVSPCFVVVHPKGTLLWDTGLGDHLAGKGPVTDGGVTLQVERSLQSQLQLIGVKRIDYLAFSHTHFDHTGNAQAFPNATWLVNRQELDAALKNPGAFVNPDHIRPPRQARQITIEGDHDVFGDGSVRILRTPGHTEGHQVLLLRLAGSGPVILSGDLYHTRENRHYQRVPAFNASRADTLASMNRIETIARNLGARIIVQHDPADFAALPQAPAYLE